MKLVYDVPHNIAKLEQHKVDGREKTSASIAKARRARSRRVTR